MIKIKNSNFETWNCLLSVFHLNRPPGVVLLHRRLVYSIITRYSGLKGQAAGVIFKRPDPKRVSAVCTNVCPKLSN